MVPIAATVVALGAVLLWLIAGVHPDELALYLGYEALFVVGPGWLVLRAISPNTRSRACQLALGWPIGLALEILAFSLTAALGIRDLFVVYPLLVAVPALLVLRRRQPVEPRSASAPAPLFTQGARWTIAGLCLLAFAYIGVAYFAITPLPGSVPAVVYPGDITFQISNAAGALHHWPPVDSRVAGEPFSYHYFVDLHMAAISQVTGVHLPVIVFRLYLIPLSALLILQLALAGRLIGGRVWAGPLTVALFLLIREIDLSVSDILPFGGIGMIYLWASPSQMLGLIFFVPALLVLACMLDRTVSSRAAPYVGDRPRALWAALALLLVGAGGAKSTILPMLIGGLLLFVVWTGWTSSRVDRTALAALALCVGLFAAYLLLMYRGGTHGVGFDPPGTVMWMHPLQRVHAAWPNGPVADAAYWAIASPVGTALYFAAPALGLAWFLRRDTLRHEPAAVLSIAILLTGIGAFLLLYDETLEQTYFTLYGLVAVFPLAATGLIAFFDRHLPLERKGVEWRPLALFAAAWVAGVVVIALLADRLATDGHPLDADLVSYGPVALVVGALGLVAVRSAPGTRARLTAYAVVAVLLTAALDTPLDLIPNTVRKLTHGSPLYAAEPARGVRPREFEGMEWIRDHLAGDAILAVSNDRTPRTRLLASYDNDYPAFTERSTFREGWIHAARTQNDVGQTNVLEGRADPFPERRALEDDLYRRGDPEALDVMVRRFGVTHIVVSTKDGGVSPRVYRLGRLVFSNGALDVIDVTSGERQPG